LRRFKFSLESVLTIRQKALDDAQIQLASITSVYNTQNDVLQEMMFDLKAIENEASSYIEGEDFNPDIISNYGAYLNKLSQDIETQKQIIERTRQDLLIQQEFTKQAYIKVKSLENLKQKQKEDYQKELLLEEFKEIDDIVNSRRSA